MNIFDVLIYLPVISVADPIAFQLCTSCLLNIVRGFPSKYLIWLSNKSVIFCDSGGLQIFKALGKGKIVDVGPMLRSIIRDPLFFTLGTITNCVGYQRLKSTVAALIDFPVSINDSDLVFWWKISQSRKATAHQIKAAPILCPETELVIVLQPRHPQEISLCYSFMFEPTVQTYALPVRDFRNAPGDQIGNSYMLSFLHERGIRRVHILGSSAPCVIFLMAQAAAMKMFDRITFDSLTWNQRAMSGHRFLDPYTLDPIPNQNQRPLHPKADIRAQLLMYPGAFEETIAQFHPPLPAQINDWGGIYNIRAIEEFKNLVLTVAMHNDLYEFINEFPRYTERQKEQIIQALNLLEDAKAYGHGYVERNYASRI